MPVCMPSASCSNAALAPLPVRYVSRLMLVTFPLSRRSARTPSEVNSRDLPLGLLRLILLVLLLLDVHVLLLAFSSSAACSLLWRISHHWCNELLLWTYGGLVAYSGRLKTGPLRAVSNQSSMTKMPLASRTGIQSPLGHLM